MTERTMTFDTPKGRVAMAQAIVMLQVKSKSEEAPREIRLSEADYATLEKDFMTSPLRVLDTLVCCDSKQPDGQAVAVFSTGA